jgi:YVTN family beta-propeller protein
MTILASCNQLARNVTAVDTATWEKIATVDTLPEPHVMIFDPVRHLLYVTITYRDGIYDAHGDRGHEIAVIDPGAWEVVRSVDIAPYAAPHDMAIVGDFLYVACESHGGCVLALDLETLTPSGHVTTGAVGPHWLSVNDNKAYTGNKEAPFVSVLDLAERRMIGKIPTPGGAEDLEISGDLLYINDRTESLLRIVDTTTDTQVGQITLPDAGHRIHFLPTGLVAISHLHLPWSFDRPDPGSVSVVDPAAGEVVARVPVGSGPLGITSADGTLYVNNSVSGTTTVIDTGTYEVTATIPMDRGAHEIVVI